MSMLSTQVDELRELATRYDELQAGVVRAVRIPLNMGSVLREAADTIWELRCRLVDAEDRVRKRDEAELEAIERVNMTHERMIMSHFATAVLSDGTKTLEELLAPYQENNMDDVPAEFLEFHDAAEEESEKYENDTTTFVKYKGRLYSPYDAAFRKPDASRYGFSTSDYEVPEDLPRINIPFKVIYPTIEEYLRDYCGYDALDERTGKYGYWENPNAKWDWFEVGGRWKNWAEDTIGGTVVRVGDITFDPDFEREKASAWWDQMQVEDPLYFKLATRGRTKEQYVESQAHLSFRACITPDGKWHEVGEMGWFGMSSESGDERQDWDLAFSERFLTDPDLTLFVVDCHI
ncbi:MAG: hypothetical protein J6D54_12750 [Olsenella sp.]|nr:hypothetical protein [Olsenella sp.]